MQCQPADGGAAELDAILVLEVRWTGELAAGRMHSDAAARAQSEQWTIGRRRADSAEGEIPSRLPGLDQLELQGQIGVVDELHLVFELLIGDVDGPLEPPFLGEP